MLWNGTQHTGEEVMEKKVSIIVPVYNAEKYLGYTISSIRRQTYKNIEIILVNDGSADGSLQICGNYAAIDPRIRVIDLPNGGVSAARNRGLAEASGEYVQFVDADDVIHTDMTRKLVEVMETYQKDLVVCGFQMIMLDAELRKAGQILFSSKDLGKECVLPRDVFFQNMSYILWKICLLEEVWNKIYRREIIEKHQILFPQAISLGEDFCFNMDYFQYMNGVVFIEEQFYYYLNTGKDTLTSCYRENYFDNQLFLIQRFENILKAHIKISKEERRYLAEYMIAKAIRSIENVFQKECRLPLIEKKRKIEEIINHEYVRNAFRKGTYIDPQYEWIWEKIKFSDVKGIYDDVKAVNCREPNWQENRLEYKEVQRTMMNHILVKCCDIILKIYPLIWAEVIRDSVYMDGIKRTLKKMHINVFGEEPESEI